MLRPTPIRHPEIVVFQADAACTGGVRFFIPLLAQMDRALTRVALISSLLSSEVAGSSPAFGAKFKRGGVCQ